MASQVGPLTKAYLKRCGYSDAHIAKWDSDTRLFQDIGLVGDSAWDEFLPAPSAILFLHGVIGRENDDAQA